MAKKLEESPLGWTVVLLFIVLNAAEVLTYDIDDQLEARFGAGNGFDPQKKYWLKNYYRCMKQARHWLEVRLSHCTQETYSYLRALRTVSSSSYRPDIMEPLVIPSNIEGGVGFVGVVNTASARIELPSEIQRY